MNILLIGTPFKNLTSLLSASKHTEKIYTAINNGSDEFPNIEFTDFNELIEKALTLKIDIAINLDKELINQGIVEAFKTSRINLISVNKKWLNLETSTHSAKQLLTHYSIKTPKLIKFPLEFPVILKSDSENIETVISSMEDSIKELQKYEGKKTYFEEYSEGNIFELTSLWDGKNILFLNTVPDGTEVQKDRLDLLETKLNFMFSDENADFAGFFNTKLVWFKNDWYVKSFKMNLDENTVISEIKADLVYILNLAIYQKLNEFPPAFKECGK